MLMLVTILVGAILGLHFRVLILLPAITLVAFATAATAITFPGALQSILERAVGAIVSLQIGYLMGGVILRAAFPDTADAGSQSEVKEPLTE